MQEIIVYRSPLEAAIWHGMTFEFIVSFFVFCIILVGSLTLFDTAPYHIRRKYGSYAMWVVFFIAGYGSYLTYNHMAV